MTTVRWSVLLAAVVAAGCGTSSVAIDEAADPTVSLFADEADEPAESTATAGAPAMPGSTIERGPVPTPVDNAPGVVFRDGVALPVTAADPSGWTATLPCGDDLVAATPAPARFVVAADPGGDAGTGTDFVLVGATVAEALAAELEAVDMSSFVTRRGDADVSIGHRMETTVASGARVLVSVVVGDEPVGGLEVVHRAGDDEGRRLAGLVFVAASAELSDDGIATGGGVSAVLNQRGSDYYAALRGDDVVAVVVRLPVTDEDLAGLDAVAARVGRAMAVGVYDHLTTDATARVGPSTEVVREAAVAGIVECEDPTAGG